MATAASSTGKQCPPRVLIDGGTPAWERALVEELLNDSVTPVVLTECDPPPAALTSWLGAVCQHSHTIEEAQKHGGR